MRRYNLIQFLAPTLLIPVTALGATWKVPQQVATINGAIALSSPGDTILISKGVYDENVVLSGRSNLILRSAGHALIRPSSGIAIDIDNCTGIGLKKLRIETTSWRSVEITNSNLILLFRCRIKTVNPNPSLGVYANVSTNIQLLENRFSGDSYGGVALEATDDSLIQGNRIRGSRSIPIRVAVGQGNSVLDNQLKGGFTQILVSNGANGNLVAGNTAVRASGDYCIQVMNSSDNMIIDNRILNPAESGLYISGAGGLVQGNRIRKPGIHGIVGVTGDTWIISNRITRPGEDGIHLDGGNLGELHLNRVRKSGQIGFYLNATNLQVIGNVASKNGTYGLDEGPGASGNMYQANRFESVAP